MQFQIPIELPKPSVQINYTDKLLLLGSCFTEHIGKRFRDFGWTLVENPMGIIFNPDSIYKSIQRIVTNTQVHKDELVYAHELYHHWDFHSRFSNVEADASIDAMNKSINDAHQLINEVDWVIVTLGTAFQYFYKEGNNYGVANCHRVPANEFEKRMLSVDEIVEKLKLMIATIQAARPLAKVLFTISPVRHIKDGVVENNISKARLIEATHQLVNGNSVFYFPAYEILIDVLRDYRYYDVDLVHPNYAATQYVWEQLLQQFFTLDTQEYVKDMLRLNDALKHRPLHMKTSAYRKFVDNSLQKVDELSEKYPQMQFEIYLHHFTQLKQALES